MHLKSLVSVLLLACVAQDVTGCSKLPPGLDDPLKSKTATLNLLVRPIVAWTYYNSDGYYPNVTKPGDKPDTTEAIEQLPPQKDNLEAAKQAILVDIKKYIKSVMINDNLSMDVWMPKLKYTGSDDNIIGGMLEKDCKTGKNGIVLTTANGTTQGATHKIFDGKVVNVCNRDTFEITDEETYKEYLINVSLKMAISGAKWKEMALKLHLAMDRSGFDFEREITVETEE